MQISDRAPAALGIAVTGSLCNTEIRQTLTFLVRKPLACQPETSSWGHACCHPAGFSEGLRRRDKPFPSTFSSTWIPEKKKDFLLRRGEAGRQVSLPTEEHLQKHQPAVV